MYYDAVDIAKERLEKYLKDLFSKGNAFPESKWEFYSYLLNQAKKHSLDYSGYASPAYKEDEAIAKRRNAPVPEISNKKTSRHF